MKKLMMLVVLSVTLISCSSQNKEIKEAVVGEEMVVENFISYKVNRLDTVSKIEPSVTTGYYTYYEPQNNSNVMLDLVLEVKNESSNEIQPMNYISATFTINDADYETSILVESDGGSDISSWNGIAPNKSALVHLYTEIDKESIADEILCKLTINDEVSEIKLNRKFLAPVKDYLEYGEMIENENIASITIGETFTTKKLLPPNINGVYSYYEVNDYNDSYLVLKMTIKNNSGSAIDPQDYISCKAIVDDKYEYVGFLTWDEDNGRDLTSYSDLAPLKETTGYYLIQIPDEIIENETELKLNIFGNTYYIKKA